MASLVCSYNAKAYKTLPLIREAPVNFEECSDDSLIENLADIFLSYNMEEKYGLMLIHRHFDISANEILVESLLHDLFYNR